MDRPRFMTNASCRAARWRCWPACRCCPPARRRRPRTGRGRRLRGHRRRPALARSTARSKWSRCSATGASICAHFQPLVDAWKKKLPTDVRFSYVPAAFTRATPYARAYFAAEALGVLGKTHDAIFRRHPRRADACRSAGVGRRNRRLLRNATASIPCASRRRCRAPPSTRRWPRRSEFAVRSGVQGTPTMVVNGKYRVQAGSLQDILRITDGLIAKERAERTA